MQGLSNLCSAMAVAFLILFATAAAAQVQPKVAPIGMEHYRGTWLEIGRRPMWLTDGCVAGYSTYRRGKTPDEVLVEDGCREGKPDGRLKTISGTGRIVDFGTTNARMRVRYPLLITFNYWVLYASPDKSWFISADPDMTNLWIYSRALPSKSKLKTMVRKVSQLGYDVGKLEFPAH